MTSLVNSPVDRIFSFGCSFTKYFWAAWPEIIALDLDIPLYNFGKSGAGNQYIANMVAQADALYNFTEKDLIIVSWTNVCREDRWVKGNWITPGNIFTQGEYDQNFINKWADPVGYLIRDLASLKYVRSLLELKKCQFHFLSMCDIAYQINQSNSNETFDSNYQETVKRLVEHYRSELNLLHPSFFSNLWSNDIYKNKMLPDKEIYGLFFSDGHPNPADHLTYLKNIFDHEFKKSTEVAVHNSQKNLIDFIKTTSQRLQKPFALYELSGSELNYLEEKTKIKSSEIIKHF
jgi:hypothetical protein